MHRFAVGRASVRRIPFHPTPQTAITGSLHLPLSAFDFLISLRSRSRLRNSVLTPLRGAIDRSGSWRLRPSAVRHSDRLHPGVDYAICASRNIEVR